MLFPDCLPVVEVWLVCCGFTEAKSLAMKINTFFKLVNEQVTINVLRCCVSVSSWLDKFSNILSWVSCFWR